MKEIAKQMIENMGSASRKLGVWLKLLEESRNENEREFAMRGLEASLEQLPKNIQDEARSFVYQSGHIQ